MLRRSVFGWRCLLLLCRHRNPKQSYFPLPQDQQRILLAQKNKAHREQM